MPSLGLPASSSILCDDVELGADVEIGADVQIECQRLRLGHGVRIGCSADADFRALAGVRIQASELDLADGVVIGRCVRIRGGQIRLGRQVRVKEWNDIHVLRRLEIGARGTVNEHCEISGVDIQIGRELWMLPHAKIGGGSAFEVQSSLRAGHFLHLGMHTFVNTARAITLGDEVGLGTHTALYTHGAYPSELRGAPVAFGEIHIGDRSWLPGAFVNPGVTIGHDCIIAVGSVVTKNIPDGAMAAGVPCKVVRENAYPRDLPADERLAKMRSFLRDFADICTDRHQVAFEEGEMQVTLDGRLLVAYREMLDEKALAALRQRGIARTIVLAYGESPSPPLEQETLIDLRHRHIAGRAGPVSERLLNQLRRYGTRFRYEPVEGQYRGWDSE
jgi:acetyltransferase-like isoleucine patch superfamily enzyme